MTTPSNTPKNNSSDETVIGFEGSKQHHDLKNQEGGDPDHASRAEATGKELAEAVEKSDAKGAVSEALKDAVQK